MARVSQCFQELRIGIYLAQQIRRIEENRRKRCEAHDSINGHETKRGAIGELAFSPEVKN